MLYLIAPENDLLDNLDGVESETQNQVTHFADELSRRVFVFTISRRFLLLLDSVDLLLVVEPYLLHAVLPLLYNFHNGLDLRSSTKQIHDLLVHNLDHHVRGLELLQRFQVPDLVVPCDFYLVPSLNEFAIELPLLVDLALSRRASHILAQASLGFCTA